MNPRLENSKKWSSLPEELLTQIKGIFKETFAKQIGKAKIITEGRIYSKEILLRIGYLEPERLKQNNFEASIAYDKSKDNVMALVHIAIDSLGSMFQDFLTNEKTEFPAEWQKYDVDKKEVFLKYTTDNSELEKEANKLLNIDDEGLVQGEDLEEDLETAKKTLGID